jgi:hypothetical protein
MGDSLKYAARFDKALEVYESLVRGYLEALFRGRRLMENAMYSRSLCFERLGEPRSALKEMERLLYSSHYLHMRGPDLNAFANGRRP